MTSLKSKLFLTLGVAGMLIGIPASAQMQLGDVVVINFTATGDTVGGNWNEFESSLNNPVSDPGVIISNLNRFSNGTATSVSLNIEGSGLTTDAFGIGGLNQPFDNSRIFPGSGIIPEKAQQRVTFHTNSPQQFIFSGLDDSLTYNLSILSANTPVANVRNPHNWIANPGDDEIVIVVNPNDGLVHTFSNLSTNGSGSIILQSSTTSGGINAQHINAMELTAIPEPGTLILLGLGLGATFLFRRRGK
jgi:hypothetical protein